MTSSVPAKRYLLPNRLQELIGGPLPEADLALIATANNRLDAISDKFQDCLHDEMQRLHEAHEAYLQKNNGENMIRIHDCSHDIKGLAKTFGYPLVGRMATSLCRLTFPATEGEDCPPKLVKAHIDAIRAAVHGQIKTDKHTVAMSLVSELEQRVLEHLNEI